METFDGYDEDDFKPDFFSIEIEDEADTLQTQCKSVQDDFTTLMNNINLNPYKSKEKNVLRKRKQQSLLIDRFIPSRKATDLEAAFAI